jgi:hypothetical protein
VAIALTWLAIPLGAAGLALMWRFRAGVKPIVQRICFWSAIAALMVGTAVDLGYTIFPRGSSAVLASGLMLYAPVAIMLGVIVYYGMIRPRRAK